MVHLPKGHLITTLSLACFCLVDGSTANPQGNENQVTVISGRVAVRGDGGVEGATIECTAPKGFSCEPSKAVTEKDGAFKFKVAPSNGYWLQVSHPHYPKPPGRKWKAGETATVELDPYIIKGRVLEDETDRPIPDAEVICQRGTKPPEIVGTQTTNENGEFSFQPREKILVPEEQYILEVTHNRYGHKYARVRLSDPQEDTIVRLTRPFN